MLAIYTIEIRVGKSVLNRSTGMIFKQKETVALYADMAYDGGFTFYIDRKEYYVCRESVKVLLENNDTLRASFYENEDYRGLKSIRN